MTSRFPTFDLPARVGLGLKSQHVPEILDERPDVGWFEVHAENYMGAGGPPHRYLTAVRERYPLSVHGVGLSIGSAGPLDERHLARLAAVVERYEPAMVSEHLAWSSHGGAYFNDLLPVPYTEEALARVGEHVDRVQEALGRRILLENPSTYVSFAEAALDEIAFLEEVAGRTGCGLLLDVNNVHVSATNHGFDARGYLDRFPLELVEEIHLAGHAREVDVNGAPLLIDAHDRDVDEAVLSLFERVLARSGPLPTLIERDNDVPPWPVLPAEAAGVERRFQKAVGQRTDAVAV